MLWRPRGGRHAFENSCVATSWADCEYLDGSSDVLQLARTKFHDTLCDFVLDLIFGSARQKYFPGLANAFETRGDIHAVAHQVPIAFDDYVSQMNPYTE